MKKRNNFSVYLLIFFGLVLIIFIALIVKNKILMSPLEPGDRCTDTDGGANFIAYGEVYKRLNQEAENSKQSKMILKAI